MRQSRRDEAPSFFAGEGDDVTDQKRLPPVNEDAEKGVLGSILQNCKNVMATCQALRVEPETFYLQPNRVVFEAMQNLNRSGKVCDAITVDAELKRIGKEQAAGGMVYIEHLIDSTPTVAHADHYIAIIVDKAERRSLITAGIEAQVAAYDEKRKAPEIINGFHAALFRIARTMENAKTNMSAANEQISDWNRAFSTEGVTLPWVYPTMHRRCGGMRLGKSYYLGGPSTSGKTLIVKKLLRYWAWDLKIPCAFASIDDTHADVIGSIACEIAAVPKFDLDHGKSAGTLLGRTGRLQIAHKTMQDILAFDADGKPKLPLWINDDLSNFDEFEQFARFCKHKHGIKAMSLDYLQILDAGKQCHAKKEHERFSWVANRIRRLAKELDITILVISQMSGENVDSGKRPNPNSLFGARGIFQAAWGVYQLWKDEEGYHLECTKNKSGKTGVSDLKFDRKIGRFSDGEDPRQTELGIDEYEGHDDDDYSEFDHKVV